MSRVPVQSLEQKNEFVYLFIFLSKSEDGKM